MKSRLQLDGRPALRNREQQLEDWLEEARRHDHDIEPHEIQSSLRAFEDEQCLGESAGGVGRRVNPLPRCD